LAEAQDDVFSACSANLLFAASPYLDRAKIEAQVKDMKLKGKDARKNESPSEK